jgi:hypothetical protein
VLGGENDEKQTGEELREQKGAPQGKGSMKRTLSHVELDLISSPQRVLLKPLCLVETGKKILRTYAMPSQINCLGSRNAINLNHWVD